jgi:nucleoside-diphosphate-sugar epimerase
MGPYVVKALEGGYELRLSDIQERMPTRHEYRQVDVSNLEQVVDASKGVDAIINLSVLRRDRKLAFDVNTRGCYNMMTAAVMHGIKRVVNSGPHFTIAGQPYEVFDFNLNPDVPPQPGTNLYAITKSLGQEICRIFSENHDLYVLCLLFYILRKPGDAVEQSREFTSFIVSWDDCGRAFRHALEVDLRKLPSRCEVFNISADLPHGRFSNEKAKQILGWRPTHNFEESWRKTSL